ncbi:ABC transporter permease [Actinoplanes sp. NEAU-A12]|uniref:ABC transporter permease n=1 Tax=Actinoplanes sandaracinus TaxID=3045177 RepID=A0ABT6WFJ3_9ACTN|nr:ABC transporter permease [Actinoplanes sandaracinus]MDI6098465.1 ABC transporter permease [Actinoplanes sandaracinus]
MSDPNLIAMAEAPAGSGRPRSLAGDAWHDLRRNKIFWASSVLVLVVLLMALAPSLFTSADPAACALSNKHKGPAGGALFGYDFQGCDVFARTVHGTRNSIEVGFLSTLLAGVIGLCFGLAAGYYGGAVDAVLSRGIDIVLGIPFLLGAVVFSGRLSAGEGDDGVTAVTLTLGLLAWTSAARVMRSSVVSAKSQDYVAAARMLGAGPLRLMFRHILPNSIAPFIVVLTLMLGANIAAEATLSYLGVGLKGEAISWGVQIADAQGQARVAAGPLVWPSVFLAATVLAFIMLGDAVRDAFDPKLR